MTLPMTPEAQAYYDQNYKNFTDQQWQQMAEQYPQQYNYWNQFRNQAPAPTPSNPNNPQPTDPTTPNPGPGTTLPTQIVPGSPDPNAPNQINVVDYGGQVAADPSLGFSNDMKMSGQNQAADPNTPGTNVTAPQYQPWQQYAEGTAARSTNAESGTAEAAQQEELAQVTQVDPRQAQGFNSATTQQNVEQNGQMTAQQGQLSQGSQINLDEVGQASPSAETQKALSDYAFQDISRVIDTSTPAGQTLANQAGRFGYVDSKATVQGQLESLSKQFTDPVTGEPRIPSWAAPTARAVSRIAAFKGVTGTAQTAAMAQALLEASLPIAQSDATAFQTINLQNLSNAQSSILNKANVLAKFDLANADNRLAAAIQNSKNFLEMDMANLNNRQQAEIINTQARVQSILEDAKAINTERMFEAQSQNDMDMFYDNLNSRIQEYNSTAFNTMQQFNANLATDVSKQNAALVTEVSISNAQRAAEQDRFNAAEANALAKFNAELETSREKFYREMQYNVDIANAKWRQTITLQEDIQQFEAAATDVKNMVGMSSEQLNQLWDRADSLLNYLWQSTENELNRKQRLTELQISNDQKDQEGFGSLFGSIAGAIAGSDQFLDWIF